MASSKGSPGPHDRRHPKTQCVKLTSLNKRCKRAAIGVTQLCKSHSAQAQAQLATEAELDAALDSSFNPDNPRLDKYPQPTPAGIQRGAITSALKKQTLSTFVVNEQARSALQRLGKPSNTDPRQTLLDLVASSWRQQQVWEQMLAAIPEDDWSMVGVTPVPGSQHSAKGARIEAIQKFLGEATKAAARTSKLAIDAGIEERLVRLAEDQAALIADTVKSGITSAIRVLALSLKLSPENAKLVLDEALGSAAHQLRLLATVPTNDDSTDTNSSTMINVTPEPRRTFPDLK